MHASQNKRNRPVPQAVTIARFRKQRCPTPQRQHRDEPDLGSPNLRVNTPKTKFPEPPTHPSDAKQSHPAKARQDAQLSEEPPKAGQPKRPPPMNGYLEIQPRPVNGRVAIFDDFRTRTADGALPTSS